jgi:hypothetical protein
LFEEETEMHNDYTSQKLYEAKRNDFMEEAELSRLRKQAKPGLSVSRGLRQRWVRGATMVAAVFFLLSLFVMNAGAHIANPAQASAATPLVAAGVGATGSAQNPADARNNSVDHRLQDKWRSLPAPYSHNVAELNDIRTYDIPRLTYNPLQATDARAQKEWKQEPAPFNHSVVELNELKQEYRKAAGLP